MWPAPTGSRLRAVCHAAPRRPRPDHRHVHVTSPRESGRAACDQRSDGVRGGVRPRRLGRGSFADLRAKAGEEANTYFELTTAAAFAFFADQAVNAAVLEVGLGGRLDATNVVDAEVCVLTSIGIEHTEYLGEDVATIAGEKLAIAGANATPDDLRCPSGGRGVVGVLRSGTQAIVSPMQRIAAFRGHTYRQRP